MVHLRGLSIDQDPIGIHRCDFQRSEDQVDDPIFTTLYLNGGMKNNQLERQWKTAGPASANGALLWPSTLEYFYEMSRTVM